MGYVPLIPKVIDQIVNTTDEHQTTHPEEPESWQRNGYDEAIPAVSFRNKRIHCAHVWNGSHHQLQQEAK